MRFKEMTITPKMAQAIRDDKFNQHNRVFKMRNVASMASDMKEGRWKMSGQPIIFNGDGTLIDGHHRIMACIRADAAFTTLVVEGVDHDAIIAIDTGAPRKYGDILTMRGHKCVNIIAPAVRLIFGFDTGASALLKNGGEGASVQQLDAVLFRNPGLEEFCRKAYNDRTVKTGVQAGLYWLFRKKDERMADWFFARLKDGVALNPTWPVYHLRAALEQDASSRIRKMDRVSKLAIFIKAWNLTRQGRHIAQLKWRGYGPKAEDFPTIE